MAKMHFAESLTRGLVCKRTSIPSRRATRKIFKMQTKHKALSPRMKAGMGLVILQPKEIHMLRLAGAGRVGEWRMHKHWRLKC